MDPQPKLLRSETRGCVVAQKHAGNLMAKREDNGLRFASVEAKRLDDRQDRPNIDRRDGHERSHPRLPAGAEAIGLLAHRTSHQSLAEIAQQVETPQLVQEYDRSGVEDG